MLYFMHTHKLFVLFLYTALLKVNILFNRLKKIHAELQDIGHDYMLVLYSYIHKLETKTTSNSSSAVKYC